MSRRRLRPVLANTEVYGMYREQFAFSPHALVNFVGGGGKTGLIHKLMHEFSAQGPVFGTTTTRIHPPDPLEGIALISGDNIDLLRKMTDGIARGCADRPYKLLVTQSYLSPTLLRGLPPDFGKTLDRAGFPILLNEADGAEYLVPVLGLDCLHQPVGAQAIFRFEKFLEHFSERASGGISPQLAADILMHPRGVCQGWKPGVTIIPFINKVDAPEQEPDAKDLAQKILRNGNFPVDAVVYGSLFFEKAASLRAL
jgi:hypothetical protein